MSSDETMSSTNRISRVAIVGAGGSVGKYVAQSLIEGGKHQVTAITRPDSTNKMPSGLHAVKKVDYNDHESLVDALKGQEFLVLTIGVMAARDTQSRLMDAAAAAGVKWVMPNEWGTDHSNEELGKDTMLGPRLLGQRQHAEKVGLTWIGFTCGFWYEFSLAGSESRYGFDFDKKELTLFDDGTEQICTTTWAQCGRAVASLLALPIHSDSGPCLEQWQRKTLYVSSFLLSQRQMLGSVLRVTGDKESDWTIKHENSKERYENGKVMFSKGDMTGFGILLYTRVFFKNGGGDYSKQLQNDILGLPKEDLDERTKVAVQMAHEHSLNSYAGTKTN